MNANSNKYLLKKIKKQICKLKININVLKIQKWYKYWKLFQNFKLKFHDEFKILFCIFRCNGLSYKQKFNYINVLKETWIEFNKFIPNDKSFSGKEGNRVFLEYLFIYKKEIIKLLPNDKYYYQTTLHPITGCWHPEIIKYRYDLSFFNNLQNSILNKLHNLVNNIEDYRNFVNNGSFGCLNTKIPLNFHQPLMQGKTLDCVGSLHTINDFPIKNIENMVNNLIYIFDYTYFPYLLYNIMNNDQQNIIYNYYRNKYFLWN
jgi:hypothetical protein